MLEGVSYHPLPNWNNFATAGEVEEITITLSSAVDDSVDGGAGGAGLSSVMVVDVDVEAVNDAPSWIMPRQSSLPLRGQEGTIEPTWVFQLNTIQRVLVTSM